MDRQRLVECAEDQADARAAVAAEERRAAGEEYLASALVDRLASGEPPLRVWRTHRGLSLRALASAAGIAGSYLSQLENGRRDGAPRVWRALATALRLDVDDILPN